MEKKFYVRNYVSKYKFQDTMEKCVTTKIIAVTHAEDGTPDRKISGFYEIPEALFNAVKCNNITAIYAVQKIKGDWDEKK